MIPGGTVTGVNKLTAFLLSQANAKPVLEYEPILGGVAITRLGEFIQRRGP
jgi:hypothetical protein